MEIPNDGFPRYISGEEICSRYKLVPSQLIELVRQGIIPVYPLSGTPLVCLTGEQAWQFECICFVLGATTLVLTLYDCGSKVPNFKPISFASRQKFAFKALNKLQEQMPDWVIGALSAAPAQRQPAYPEEPNSSARHEYPSDFKTDFLRSRMLLAAATDQEESYKLLKRINDLGSQWLDENNQYCNKYPKILAYDFLCGFFLEQSHDKLEHPLVVEFLDQFSVLIPVLLEYYNPLMVSNQCHSFLLIDHLRDWSKAPNLYRLYTLIEIVKDFVSEGKNLPLPWANVLCETRPEEFASALLKASFKERLVDKILSVSKMTPESKGQPEEQAVSQLEVPVENQPKAPTDGQSKAQATTEPQIAVEEEISQDCNKEAEYFRARRDGESKIKARRKWEVAALKCEGYTHLEIHKCVFPEREQDDARELNAVPEKAKVKHSKKIADKNECYIAKEIGKVRTILETENQPIPKALRPYGK